jgi:hypothetical protein
MQASEFARSAKKVYHKAVWHNSGICLNADYHELS